MRLLLAACACAAAAGLRLQSAKTRPIDRVVSLLKDMQKTLVGEQGADDTQFKKFSCWCNTNESEKTEAIEEAQRRVSDLRADIESLTANGTELHSLLETTKTQLAADSKALADASGIREKEAAAFHADHSDSLTAVENLKGALTVLNKHYGDRSVLAQITGEVHASDPALVAAKALLRRQQVVLAQDVSGGEIMGVLRQMLVSMAGDALAAEERETAAAASFIEMRDAKRAQIKSSKKLIAEKTAEDAQTSFELQDAVEDLANTEAQLEADTTFLGKTRASCKTGAADHETRQAARTKEAAAVSETLSILTSDEARDKFNESVNSAFAQRTLVSSHARSGVAAPATELLATAAQLNAFTKVKAEIDRMVARLGHQRVSESQHRDYCIGAAQKNAVATTDAEDLKTDTETAIDGFESDLEKLDAERESAEKALQDTRVSLQEAGENRQEENKAYQQTVQDQRDTQGILKKAQTRLAAEYAFLQAPASVVEGNRGKHAGADGVLNLLSELIADTKELELDAVSEESTAQVAYEIFVSDANSTVKSLLKAIIQKKATAAQVEEDIASAHDSLREVVSSLESLAKEKADLGKACDFFLKNFDVRQDAIAEEIEGLKQAKSILAGAQ